MTVSILRPDRGRSVWLAAVRLTVVRLALRREKRSRVRELRSHKLAHGTPVLAYDPEEAT
jgi:hypothetical protein